jgi:hypothetical protein
MGMGIFFVNETRGGPRVQEGDSMDEFLRRKNKVKRYLETLYWGRWNV